MEANTLIDQVANQSPPNFFTGSVPRNYDTYAGPLLFTPYALDLVSRIKVSGPVKVLELAAGTGRLTRQLLEALPEATISATDISEDMMTVAKETIQSDRLTWHPVNMMEIPFSDNEFDLVICQFGLMFAPDKLKTLKEMQRVLKPAGQLLLNTWGSMEENPLWHISFSLLASTVDDQPFSKEMGPFALPDLAAVQSLVAEAGFRSITATEVRKISQVASASLAAEGFLKTSPALAQKPELYPLLHQRLQHELAEKLGDNPLNTTLLALVFEATK